MERNDYQKLKSEIAARPAQKAPNAKEQLEQLLKTAQAKKPEIDPQKERLFSACAARAPFLAKYLPADLRTETLSDGNGVIIFSADFMLIDNVCNGEVKESLLELMKLSDEVTLYPKNGTTCLELNFELSQSVANDA